jgi:hypothetical protein
MVIMGTVSCVFILKILLCERTIVVRNLSRTVWEATVRETYERHPRVVVSIARPPADPTHARNATNKPASKQASKQAKARTHQSIKNSQSAVVSQQSASKERRRMMERFTHPIIQTIYDKAATTTSLEYCSRS